MYINTTSSTQVSEQDIRALHPNTSFPHPFVPPAEYAYIFPAPSNYDSATHAVVPSVPEQTVLGHWEQRWTLVPLSEEVIAANAAQAAIATREAAKQARTTAVAAIKVTTQAGNEFDGDEVSQGRMARAILGLSTGLAPSVAWVLADNTVIQATSDELVEALVLAGQEQAALWVI
jgi:hypothetical protein